MRIKPWLKGIANWPAFFFNLIIVSNLRLMTYDDPDDFLRLIQLAKNGHPFTPAAIDPSGRFKKLAINCTLKINGNCGSNFSQKRDSCFEINVCKR